MVKLQEPAEITLNPECFRNMSLPPNFQGNRLVVFSMPRSHMKQLDGFKFKHLPNLTSMDLRGCQFLEKIPDLSGIPNIEYLNLRDCTRLVEVDDSVGFLDKLVVLDLVGCFNLTRFATTLRLKSLKELDLGYCKRLESFPEIEVEMESLRRLDYCENLTITVNSQVSSSNSELQLLPNLFAFSLKGCNLSKSDFLLPLDCWSTLTELDLSGNNFVSLPRCISKFVNLRKLDLSDCKSLLEIPEQVLPRRVEFVLLDNCTSLEKIPKLSWVLLDNCTSLQKIPEISPGVELELTLTNCVRLHGYDITENIFLNQVSVSSPRSYFHIYLPGD
ncbi:disease resistance protein RPS6-like, partial [Prunus avium]|uniref:Disease resistance protein RPS6-like n=1 Tax=Prunus avium TaxID=42229 RepID=A0A6P5RK97_PRUAV